MTVLPVTHERHRVESSYADHSGSGFHRPRWKRRHQLVLLATDTVAAVVAALLVLRTGGHWPAVLCLPPAWTGSLAAHHAYAPASFGSGGGLYRQVLRAALVVPALAAVLGWGLTGEAELPREMMLALPAAAALSLAVRYALRRRLRGLWARGRHRTTAVLVGPAAGIGQLLAALLRDSRAGAPAAAVFQGMNLAGVCLTDSEDPQAVDVCGVPILGGVGEVQSALRTFGGDCAVVVLPSPDLDPAQMRRLSWSTAAAGGDFLIAPGYGDVSAARLAVRPVGGVPLIQVRAPRLSRWARLPKDMAERLIAALLLLLLSPLLGAVALAVRLGSRGPTLFRQVRVGLHGKPFTMLKFRTMRTDAEDRRAELAHANHNSDGLLFKVRDDPRVTRVGTTLRRYSLDELPQLLNVVTGRMSLIGPRPPLPEEVAGYSHEVRRRLLVKPGLTGLWQVSGRSDLPWEEAVRLDLAYVDNWSLTLDTVILLRTGPAVLRGTGAY
ncbi:glycosyl transferase cpsE [Streptomyces laurentii]|uniref:Glycosyl transferase cpsE n=1 Tax=Streptomyces laurentii TaxID=39478 RepID=A0A160NVE9_STRLU|nr:glycosyl transferase cpsE [Streptomyces laurentii]